MSYSIQLGAAIKEARFRLGISQTELAQMLHVSRASVSYWELGTHSPQAHHLAAMKDVLGLAWEEPGPPIKADQLAYWRGRVEQIAQHMALVLKEQERLAQDMGGAAPAADEAEALAARARATMQAHAAQVAAAAQASTPTPAPRRRKAR